MSPHQSKGGRFAEMTEIFFVSVIERLVEMGLVVRYSVLTMSGGEQCSHDPGSSPETQTNTGALVSCITSPHLPSI